MESLIVDANVFLRFFVPENKELHRRASELFERAKKGKTSLIVPQIIIFEVNYSLLKYYHFEKKQIVEALSSMISSNYFNVESKDIFTRALKIYNDYNLDLTDCFLVVKQKMGDGEVFTFDKKLEKYAKSS